MINFSFQSQIEEADQALKYTTIYMGRSLNPLFITLQEIDKSKGSKSSLELVEIQHVDIVIFCNTTDYVTVTCNDVGRQFSEEDLSGVIKHL